MTSSTRTKPAPPAAAVAADAHWAAKMERLRNRTLAETVFVVCDDQTIRDRYLRAQRDHDMAAQYADGNTDDAEAAADLARITAARDDAKKAYDEIAIPIRFRALPRQALEALYEQHQPSDTDTEDGKRWAESFPAALIAAASVDGMTETDAQELLDGWSLAEADAMFNAAYGVQNTTRTDLGKG